MREQKTRKVILEQKKLRLEKNSEIEEREIRKMEVALKNLDFEMNKLNGLCSNNREHQQKLTNENYNLENEFVQKLKELENESVTLETKI
jgi:chromosome segregation ATPase